MNITIVTTAPTDDQARSCCASSGCRSARAGGELRGDAPAKIAKRTKEAEVRGAAAQPLQVCGRPRGLHAQVRLCRICFRKLALEGYLPG
jgi:small subunit ribosomal protein S14